MPKWVQNVLFGVGIALAAWHYAVGDMLWAGILIMAPGFATAISAVSKPAPEKPE